MTGLRTCACGCGSTIYPRSYAHQIGSAFYTQKCVRLTIVPDEATDAPVQPAPPALQPSLR